MEPVLSIIITASKEPQTIGKALTMLLDSSLSYLKNDFEVITVIPDQETQIAAEKLITIKYPGINWIKIKDPGKGKPVALNLAFQKAKGDYILLSDGDVYCDTEVIPLLMEHFKNKSIGGVTGRPKAVEQKTTFWGYIGNLLADAAHHKRMTTMGKNRSGHSAKLISSQPDFFVLSGYISLIKNLKLSIPEDCLVDDAYISYRLINKGFKLAYEPKALVYVKYPTHITDWFAQKARSVGGYMQLWKYGVVKEENKVRNFWKELEYFWFPIKYASNFRELCWSLMLYPLRFYLWLRILFEQKVLKKEFYQTWVRIESTK